MEVEIRQLSGQRLYELTDRTRWTKPILERLISLYHTGVAEQAIIRTLRREFGYRTRSVMEMRAEMLFFDKYTVDARFWTPMKEFFIMSLYSATTPPLDSKQIHERLQQEYRYPYPWVETYAKIQELILDGLLRNENDIYDMTEARRSQRLGNERMMLSRNEIQAGQQEQVRS